MSKTPKGGIKGYRASHRYARISATKARPVIDLVRGRPVDEALEVLQFEPRRAAPMIRKVIQSALANASADLNINLRTLVVADARVDGAGLLNGRQRWQPRAMGRAFPIRKEASHISVVLAPGTEE